MPDGRLLFASDRGGDGFRIFVTGVDTRDTSRLEDAGANASSPEPSRDGRTLVFVGYTPAGIRPLLASARVGAMDDG